MQIKVDNCYELLHLLQNLNDILFKKYDFEENVILFPVKLDEFYFIGANKFMVYYANQGKGENLRGLFFKEFMPRYWKYEPKIRLEDKIWLFKSYGSGPFANRFRICKEESLIGEIKQLIVNFQQEFKNKFKNLHTYKGSNIPQENAWRACILCHNIPERSYAYWKGGDLMEGEIPENEKFLEIVGAPTFDDNTGYRHWCLKLCPNCGSYFLWDFTYEYLTNGSEDEITLIRLNENETREWLNKVSEKLKPS